MAIFFCLQSGRCREVQLYILNNDLLLGAKEKERQKPDLSTSIIFYPLRS